MAERAKRRGADWALGYVVAAGVVLWLAWPGRASDSAVAVNRIEVPAALIVLGLLAPLARRFCGPVRPDLLTRAGRAGGYLLVLTLTAAIAVQAREGETLGVYFHDGGIVTGVMILVLAGYAAGILAMTSARVRLTASALRIATAAGLLTGAALYAGYGIDLASPPRAWWALAALGLPMVTGWAVTRLAARTAPATPASRAGPAGLIAGGVLATALVLVLPLQTMFILVPIAVILPALILAPGVAAKLTGPRRATATDMNPGAQGAAAAVSATAIAVLLLATLTTATIALSPSRVPLQTPPPPRNGGCETCDPNSRVIPPGLRHEYWVGLSVTQASLPVDIALIGAPLIALPAAGIGVGLGQASSRGRHRLDPADVTPASGPSYP